MKRVDWQRVVLVAALVIVALFVAACGGDDPTPTPVPATATSAPAAAPTEEATEAPSEAATEAASEAAEPAATEAATAADSSAEAAATEAPEAESSESMTVTVDSARMIEEVVDEKDVYFSSLSPDGANLAWFVPVGKRDEATGSICLFTFETAGKVCNEMAPGAFVGYPYELEWSPDSSMITFTENPIELANEADIWLFRVADSSFTNLTDDGVKGSWRYDESGALVNIDYAPAWNAADGKIYFWRLIPFEGASGFSSAIFSISPDGGEAEGVRQLTTDLPIQFPLFYQEKYFMDGFTAVSPDGAQLASLVSKVSDFGFEIPSLVLIDLKNTDAAPKVLMTGDQMQAAFPEWIPWPAAAEGLSWTADGKGLVVVVNQASNVQTPFQVYYYVDVATGEATPVVDFSGIVDESAYFAVGGDWPTLPPRAYSPWTGSLSPQGDKLLTINELGGAAGLFMAPLPPTGELPVVVESTEEPIMSMASRSSRSNESKLTLYGILLNITE